MKHETYDVVVSIPYEGDFTAAYDLTYEGLKNWLLNNVSYPLDDVRLIRTDVSTPNIYDLYAEAKKEAGLD